MIWLLLHPLPPLSRQPATQGETEKERQLADGRGGRGCWRSQIIRPQEGLYKSFDILRMELPFNTPSARVNSIMICCLFLLFRALPLLTLVRMALLVPLCRMANTFECPCSASPPADPKLVSEDTNKMSKC